MAPTKVFSCECCEFFKNSFFIEHLMMMMMMMMMMICFRGMVDRRKTFSLISSRDHCQRSSPSWISNTLQAEFEPAQKLLHTSFTGIFLGLWPKGPSCNLAEQLFFLHSCEWRLPIIYLISPIKNLGRWKGKQKHIKFRGKIGALFFQMAVTYLFIYFCSLKRNRFTES